MSGASRARRRALLALVNESRRRVVPEPDWVKMEEDLERRLDHFSEEPGQREPSSVPRVPFVGWKWAAVTVSLGAMVWGVTQLPSSSTSEPRQATSAVEARPPTVLDGGTLRVGQRVAAAAEPLTVVHGTLTRWTLEPGGRAQWLVGGRLLTVGLEAGAVEVEVAPGSQREAFAVEVGQTRIAVHGTRFRVERGRSGAMVTVQEGTVVIGSAADRGRMSGTLLTAPNHAHVNLAGRLLAPRALRTPTAKRVAPERTADSRRPAVNPDQSDLLAAAGAAARLAEKPREVTAEPPAVRLRVADEMELAERRVRECFARHTNPAGGVLVTARTELEVKVSPSGAVTTVRLSPPLAPPVQRCAAAALKSMRFGPSERGRTESRVLFLGR